MAAGGDGTAKTAQGPLIRDRHQIVQASRTGPFPSRPSRCRPRDLQILVGWHDPLPGLRGDPVPGRAIGLLPSQASPAPPAFAHLSGHRPWPRRRSPAARPRRRHRPSSRPPNRRGSEEPPGRAAAPGIGLVGLLLLRPSPRASGVSASRPVCGRVTLAVPTQFALDDFQAVALAILRNAGPERSSAWREAPRRHSPPVQALCRGDQRRQMRPELHGQREEPAVHLRFFESVSWSARAAGRPRTSRSFTWAKTPGNAASRCRNPRRRSRRDPNVQERHADRLFIAFNRCSRAISRGSSDPNAASNPLSETNRLSSTLGEVAA